MSAEITQTAGVCVSDRAWNFEERERRKEGGREGGCWRGLVSLPLPSHHVNIHAP